MGVDVVADGRHRDHPDALANGPIYIGGLDRSGKTTMRAFLASHPRIAIPEVGSNMWTYFYRRFGDLSDDENFEACLTALAGYKHVAFLRPALDEIRREFVQGERTYARLFALFLIQYADRQGKPRWGAQTGLIERYAPEVFAAYPGVRVIHMIRDPRDRYEASVALWPDGRGRAGGAVARWRYSEGLATRHEARWPDRYKVVRFEDMITDPEGTLRSVCTFLGETFHIEMLEMSAGEKHRTRMAAGSPQTSVLSKEFIGRYMGRVSREDAAFIQIQLRRGMGRRGYEPDPITFNAREWLRFVTRSFPDQAARMVAWRSIEALQESAPRIVGRKPGRRMLIGDTS